MRDNRPADDVQISFALPSSRAHAAEEPAQGGGGGGPSKKADEVDGKGKAGTHLLQASETDSGVDSLAGLCKHCDRLASFLQEGVSSHGSYLAT